MGVGWCVYVCRPTRKYDEKSVKVLSCPTAFGREDRWAHLTTPQHLCCTLVGLINSGFVGISLEKGKEKRTQVTFGHFVLPSGSVQMPPSWGMASWNFSCQNWPSLLSWSRNHCLWFYLDMIIEASSWYSWLFHPTREHPFEDKVTSFIFLSWNDTQWHLWKAFISVGLNWITTIYIIGLKSWLTY